MFSAVGLLWMALALMDPQDHARVPAESAPEPTPVPCGGVPCGQDGEAVAGTSPETDRSGVLGEMPPETPQPAEAASKVPAERSDDDAAAPQPDNARAVERARAARVRVTLDRVVFPDAEYPATGDGLLPSIHPVVRRRLSVVPEAAAQMGGEQPRLVAGAGLALVVAATPWLALPVPVLLALGAGALVAQDVFLERVVSTRAALRPHSAVFLVLSSVGFSVALGAVGGQLALPGAAMVVVGLALWRLGHLLAAKEVRSAASIFNRRSRSPATDDASPPSHSSGPPQPSP